MDTIRKFNHVALRCTDAAKTVDFYTKAMGLRLSQAFQNDYVPSMNMDCPHLHIFFELPDGSGIAFFEIPTLPAAIPDKNTPVWAQHIAFDVAGDADLLAGKQRLEAHGVKVTGPIDHGVGHSIYFFDPSGHRLELVFWLDSSTEGHDRHMREARPVLERWLERKKRGFGTIENRA